MTDFQDIAAFVAFYHCSSYFGHLTDLLLVYCHLCSAFISFYTLYPFNVLHLCSANNKVMSNLKHLDSLPFLDGSKPFLCFHFTWNSGLP